MSSPPFSSPPARGPARAADRFIDGSKPRALIPFCRQLPSWGFARALGPSWQGSRSSKTHLLAVVLPTPARLIGRERLAEGSAAGRVKPLLLANPHSAL